jgi:hypothetical protein
MLVESQRARMIQGGPGALKVRNLLDGAKESLLRELIERRSKVRYPFFCPATLRFEHGRPNSFSVFTRDLSRSGVGLLHGMELPRQTARLTISPDSAEAVELCVEIAWCRPCGDGWFISGGLFLE